MQLKSVFLNVRFLKETVLSVSGATVLGVAVLLFVFGVAPAHAVTTYELESPTQSVLVDFPHVGSGVSATPNYDFGYKIPLGVKFDRIQISVPDAQGTTKTPAVYLFSNVGTWFYSCLNTVCINDDSFVYDFGAVTQSVPQVGTLQWVFSTTTTITTSSQYFRFLLDPNPSYVDFSYHGVSFATGASLNGYNYTKSNVVPVIKFCNGACEKS